MTGLRLKARILLATAGLVTFVVVLTGGLFLFFLQGTIQQQLGENALDLARTVSRMPHIHEALATPDPSRSIQPLAEQLRLATGASFVVVGDRHGIRYSHPNPARIGEPMVGGDNAPALEDAQEYISVATGTLGRSIRGKAPILADDEQVIGIVSVGFLLPEVRRLFWQYLPGFGLIFLLGLAAGLPGAWMLSRSITRATHGLEPNEIGALAQQREAILGAIREGIIAIDADGMVVVANATARQMVPGLTPGAHLTQILPTSRLPDVLRTGEPEFDQRMLVGDFTVVTNRIPVHIDGRVAGVVASFRDQSELDRLARELSDTRRYTDDLRAQAHEFANTLQAISGMLQLGQVEDAVDFIQETSEENRELVESLPRSIAEPAVAALLLGKRARAEELHCEFTVDPDSRLDGALPDANLMVRVVGNLVDNALEAVQDEPPNNRQVRVLLVGREEDVQIEVADSGPGVPESEVPRLFEEGYSSKGPGRGIGLALVERVVRQAGGRIEVGRAPEGGALFRVTLPRPKEV